MIRFTLRAWSHVEELTSEPIGGQNSLCCVDNVSIAFPLHLHLALLSQGKPLLSRGGVWEGRVSSHSSWLVCLYGLRYEDDVAKEPRSEANLTHLF